MKPASWCGFSRASRLANAMSRHLSTATLSMTSCPATRSVIDRPDILIVEGLNVLQPPRPTKGGYASAFVSDFFDFSIYLDAEEDMLRSWYVERFMRLRTTAFRDPKSYFPSLRRDQRSRSSGNRHRAVGAHQPHQSQREHPADETAREPDPAQGRRSRHRGGGAQGVCEARRSVVEDQIFMPCCSASCFRSTLGRAPIFWMIWAAASPPSRAEASWPAPLV